MPQRGLTLLELLITLVILSLLLSIGLPSFQRQIDQSRAHTATQSLMSALQATRHRAIARNGRATLRAQGGWENGWELFDDLNHNGVRDEGEPIILSHALDGRSVLIEGNQPVSSYVSYVGSGQSRHASGTPRGGFQAGTITICTSDGAEGYKLVLARMGRVRREPIGADSCTSSG